MRKRMLKLIACFLAMGLVFPGQTVFTVCAEEGAVVITDNGGAQESESETQQQTTVQTESETQPQTAAQTETEAAKKKKKRRKKLPHRRRLRRLRI